MSFWVSFEDKARTTVAAAVSEGSKQWQLQRPTLVRILCIRPLVFNITYASASSVKNITSRIIGIKLPFCVLTLGYDVQSYGALLITMGKKCGFWRKLPKEPCF